MNPKDFDIIMERLYLVLVLVLVLVFISTNPLTGQSTLPTLHDSVVLQESVMTALGSGPTIWLIFGGVFLLYLGLQVRMCFRLFGPSQSRYRDFSRLYKNWRGAVIIAFLLIDFIAGYVYLRAMNYDPIAVEWINLEGSVVLVLVIAHFTADTIIFRRLTQPNFGYKN